jgi:hypothetical protein
MGLLDLFLQNKTTLDVEQVPTQGNGPVGTPTGEFNTGVTPFQQVWDSNKTYINSFIGGTNTGIQPPTLTETGLDIDNPNYIPSTTTPNTLTLYPATALGGLGQSAVQFLQIWSPVINYNDVVVGASTSPLAQSLPETGLDNTDPSTVPTTVSPINNTDYPNLATGEYNSVSNQYDQVYTPNNTYLDSFNPNTQINSLGDTGLDIENIGLVSTTISPTSDTDYPSLSSGEFGGQSNNFNQTYTPNNTYLDAFNPQTQPDTVIQGQTGLDNTNPLSSPTTTTPSTTTQYPQFVQGEFSAAPSQYSQVWGPTNQYIINYNSNTQPNTLDETGLDNTDDNFAPTTSTPSTTTQYPLFVQGEFNAAPTQYSQIWGPANQYIINYNSNTQPNTINNGETGLDNTNLAAFDTAFVPDPISSPTSYPQPAQTYLGEFQGAPSQFNPLYNPNPGQSYLDNYSNIISDTNNQQISALSNTGLDIENADAAPTTYAVPGIDNNTVYPLQVTGEYNGAPSPYGQTYTPSSTYEDIIINATDGPISIIENSNQFTGLDIENQNAAPTTYVVPEIDDTVYPVVQGAFITNRIPKPFKQTYTPSNQYYSYMIENFEGQII